MSDLSREDRLPTVLVDARGHHCPVPTLRLMKALGQADRVRLIADDPMARIDVPHFVAQKGLVLESQAFSEGEMTFVVSRPL